MTRQEEKQQKQDKNKTREGEPRRDITFLDLTRHGKTRYVEIRHDNTRQS